MQPNLPQRLSSALAGIPGQNWADQCRLPNFEAAGLPSSCERASNQHLYLQHFQVHLPSSPIAPHGIGSIGPSDYPFTSSFFYIRLQILPCFFDRISFLTLHRNNKDNDIFNFLYSLPTPPMLLDSPASYATPPPLPSLPFIRIIYKDRNTTQLYAATIKRNQCS
jgi:hypothetical protein